jgi:hypothetical protein
MKKGTSLRQRYSVRTFQVGFGIAALVATLAVLPGSASADAGFCSPAQYVPAHSICPERVVGRFISDELVDWTNLAHPKTNNRTGQIWLKDYVVRPFGLSEVVLSKTYYAYNNGPYGTANYCVGGYWRGTWCYLDDFYGLNSNRVVCGAVGNRGDVGGYVGGVYEQGLAASYNTDCDTAVSRFTGLPVYH